MSRFFSFSLVKNELKGRLKSLLIWASVTYMLYFIVVTLLSSFMDSRLPDLLEGMLTSLPKHVAGGFYSEDGLDLQNYCVNFGICLQLVVLVSCMYACHLGVSTVYDSINYKYYCANPVGRIALASTGILMRFANLLIFNVIFLLSCQSTVKSYGYPGLCDDISSIFLAFFGVELLIMAIGTFVSTFMDVNSSASAVSFGIILLMLICWFFGTLVPSLGFLRSLSFCTYYDVSAVLNHTADISMATVWVLSYIGVFVLIASAFRIHFRKELVI